MPPQSIWWRLVVPSLAVLITIIVFAIRFTYSRDIRAIRERKAIESQVMQLQPAPVEFATWGSGPAVLVVHGAGGGYDQGRSIATAFGGAGFKWVAPSRFGYLRTAMPADASTAGQAAAFADLLTHLGIDRVAIVAMSGGVPPSLQFALRYPRRTSALVLLSSAPFTPLTAGAQHLPVPIWVYQALFKSDFPYWALSKVARSSLETIFDVKPGLRAALTAEEKQFVNEMVDEFAPVTQRTRGLANEAAAIDPNARYPLEDMRVPTLVVHARDDGINPFAFAEYAAQHISDAEFLPLASGGHLLLGHQMDVRARVNAFLHEHSPNQSR